MKELCYGFYATRVHLPASALSRRWRAFSRRLRGRNDRFQQATRLPPVSWRECTSHHAPRIWEHGKANGNVRIGELAILAALAAGCEDGTNLFEIGTFDGRTTLNLAFNSPPRCRIHTLDLPAHQETELAIDDGERHMIDKPAPGTRCEKYRRSHPAVIGKIQQLLGDSATFDYTPYMNSCSLVFVDGSHAYDYAMSDTRAAMRMVKEGGVIVWHDYGVWEGVTKALEDLETREHRGLKHIAGTSLVMWRVLERSGKAAPPAFP